MRRSSGSKYFHEKKKIELAADTREITWQLITTADAETVKEGVLLKKQGKKLLVENLSHPEIPISIVSLNPPPHKFDRRIINLKRLELSIPAKVCLNGRTVIKVRLGVPRD